MVSTKKTILIIEDNSDARDSLALILSLEQYVVRVASTRDEALELLEFGEPEAVLIDWFMPGLALEEFVDAARGMYPSIQLVLISASLNTRKKAAELKLRSLPKPYEPAELLRQIEECIQQRRKPEA